MECRDRGLFLKSRSSQDPPVKLWWPLVGVWTLTFGTRTDSSPSASELLPQLMTNVSDCSLRSGLILRNSTKQQASVDFQLPVVSGVCLTSVSVVTCSMFALSTPETFLFWALNIKTVLSIRGLFRIIIITTNPDSIQMWFNTLSFTLDTCQQHRERHLLLSCNISSLARQLTANS